jgi:predicted 3-demethylubiquinone-9 3-methyltransferase (glyoxalase superfamily)
MTQPASVATCLWFDTQAEEAAKFYTSIIRNSGIVSVSRYGPESEMPEGLALTVEFVLDGVRNIALNGGPMFVLSPAVSSAVTCDTQAELERIWDAFMGDGAMPGQSGWLEDRYGLSWQVVPRQLAAWFSMPGASDRMMVAFMSMRKLDFAQLEAAARG